MSAGHSAGLYPGRDVLRGKNAQLLLCERARAAPEETALFVRRGGVQIARSWRDHARNIARAARVFAALGVKRGDRVAILADVCEEWSVCDMAAQTLGAIVCGIYPTSSASEIASLIRRCAPVVAVAGTPEHALKLGAAAADVTALKTIVVIAGEVAGADSRCQGYRSLMDGAEETDLAWLEERARAVPPESPAFIVFTSGTTGEPRGAVVAHGKHLAAAATLAEHFPAFRAHAQTTVVYLPPCHVLGRNVAITLPLISRWYRVSATRKSRCRGRWRR